MENEKTKQMAKELREVMGKNNLKKVVATSKYGDRFTMQQDKHGFYNVKHETMEKNFFKEG